MNRKLFNVFLVTAGAAIGSAVTWKVVKDKYERITQEEIDSVKEELRRIYENRNYCDEEAEEMVDNDDYEEPEDEEITEKPDEPEDNSVMVDYSRISSVYRSSEDDNNKNDREGGNGDLDEAPYINGPYVISPDDFRCSPPGYNAQALDYFADGVLADSWGKQLDIEETIGEESLEHFGDYVDDIVYVRNERLEIDYEVTCDLREYDQVYDSQFNA